MPPPKKPKNLPVPNRAKIFNCHHVIPDRRLDNGLFSTLVSGAHNDPAGTYLGDLDGINIAAQNIFSELRHQYYVWKNLLSNFSYVGFEHYRRVLFLDTGLKRAGGNSSSQLAAYRRRFAQDKKLAHLRIDADSFNAYWEMRQSMDDITIATLTRWIGRHDVILPRPLITDGMEKQWKSCLPVEVWDLMQKAVEQSAFGRHHRIMTPVDLCSASVNNMYIMRSDIFDEYMEFLFDCIAYMRPLVPKQHMRRLRSIWGHCGERLVNIYLYVKKVQDPLFQIGYVPYLVHLASFVPRWPNDLDLSQIDSSRLDLPGDMA